MKVRVQADAKKAAADERERGDGDEREGRGGDGREATETPGDAGGYDEAEDGRDWVKREHGGDEGRREVGRGHEVHEAPVGRGEKEVRAHGKEDEDVEEERGEKRAAMRGVVVTHNERGHGAK